MESFQAELGNSTCATMTKIEYEGDKLLNIYFLGGCHGLSSLLQRLIKTFHPTVDKTIEFLEGITCGRKGTSCANEIARILREHFNKEKL